MLKAVIIDSSAVARGLLNTVLLDGGYDVVGQTHTCAGGLTLLIKHNPHIVCIAPPWMMNDRFDPSLRGDAADDLGPRLLRKREATTRRPGGTDARGRSEER